MRSGRSEQILSSVGSTLVVLEVLGQSKVRQDDMTIRRNQDIFGLEIAINDASLVQISESHDDLSDVESGPITAQTTPACQLGGQVATGMKVECKVQGVSIVKGIVQLDNERVQGRVHGTRFQNRLLRVRMSELTVGQYLLDTVEHPAASIAGRAL